ncbi:hypothetical protein GCM10009087_28630 [Sphingomonas oligophenolica]|uniref:Universal stress protein n=1 Tax=Sphingomonas oligophenolica TaxID=301154 RepID=A0ABU9Y8F3_9SPHN
MQHILVATDLSPGAAIAVARACQIGAGWCATLHLLHVVPRSMGSIDRAMRAEELAEMARALALNHPCLRAVRSSVRRAPTASAIEGEAQDLSADLIIIGGHRSRHALDSLFGTTVDHLLNSLSRPLLVARRAVQGPYQHVHVLGAGAGGSPDALVLAAHISGARAEIVLSADGRFDEAGGPVNGDPAAQRATRCPPDLLVIAAPATRAETLRGAAREDLNDPAQTDFLVYPAATRHQGGAHPGPGT